MDKNFKKANIFTEEGRILQVEYAIKNVSNAGTTIGLICNNGVLLVGMKKGAPSLNREKIYPLTDTVHCAVSGTFPDCLQLIGYARLKAQEITEKFGVECPIETVIKRIGELKQSMTQMGGMRPFGVSILYAGMVDNEYVLFSTDPSGTTNQWKGICIGENDEQINNSIKTFIDLEAVDLNEGTIKILETIAESKELIEKDAEIVEILHYQKDQRKYLKKEEIAKILASLEQERKKKVAK